MKIDKVSDMENHKIYNLRKRMLPVLQTKVHELKKTGISSVSMDEIWKFLVDAKWKDMEEISLSEMANDILTLNVEIKET